MKIIRILALTLALLAVFSAASCGRRDDKDDISDLEGTYDVSIWVSEKQGVAEQFRAQIAAFMEQNPGIVIRASIEGVTEADVGSKIAPDVASAPDMYCFAQDQLVRLVKASALAAPPTRVAERVSANNNESSLKAASFGGQLYAYPMTSDNGYYMYYDTSVISDPDSLEKIIEDCTRAKKKIRFALEDSWYTSSFFFGAGCHSDWTMDASGNFTDVDDNFNSDAGVIAMKGMQKLTQSSCYDSNAEIFTDAAVVVTGIWNAGAAAKHFGSNLGATDLPSFTVDGKSYHLGSYTGCKLLGVKPQPDSNKAAVLALLAEYLTGEECQTQRFESFEWGPSNLKVQASDAVQSNISLVALAKQSAYGKPQGQIHGAWWDIARVLGADAKAAKTEKDLKNALEAYDKAVRGILNKS